MTGTQWQLYFQGLLQRRSLQRAGQEPVWAPESSGLLPPPTLYNPLMETPQPAGQTQGHTHRGKAVLRKLSGNKSITRGREKQRSPPPGLHLPRRSKARCLAAVPLNQAAASEPESPLVAVFMAGFVLMSEARPCGDRAGASPLPAAPSHQISTGIFMTQKGPAFYLLLAKADSLGTC